MSLLLLTKMAPPDYPSLAFLQWLVIAFICGTIPFGFLVAKIHRVDIRTVGSGNIGMTNVWRAIGWRAGLTVLILDAAKGMIPVALFVASVARFYSETMGYIPRPIEDWSLWKYYWLTDAHPSLVGLSAILGHTFSPWMRFKGGKGVATGLGVALVLFQAWLLIPVGVFVATLLLTRYVSLGSVIAASTLALITFTVPALRVHLLFGVPVLLLVLYTHRSNIRRILNGTENKVSFGRKRPQPGDVPQTPDPGP